MPGVVVVNQPTVHLGDGTTEPVAVTPANTAPTTADKALVVVLSPNQPAIAVTSAPVASTPSLPIGTIVLSALTTTKIYKTAYTEQTANFQGSIVSSSAADTAAGTGARTVNITWMNLDGTLAGVETVTLNGVTNVNLVTTTKCYIEKISVLTAGTGLVNAGTITLRSGLGGGGVIIGTIAIGDNRTFWAHHYVKSGQVCNITNMSHGNSATATGGASLSVLRAVLLPLSANGAELQISDFCRVPGQGFTNTLDYGSVIKVTGPARIAQYVTTSAATSNSYDGSFNLYDV
jgi:hypothetical protein